MMKWTIQVLIFTALTAISHNSHAALITAFSGNNFTDKGNSTIDHTSNLEWLDVTETLRRSYEDVEFDIRNNEFGGQFASSEKWRFATENELLQLLENYFGTPYPSQSNTLTDYSEFAYDDSIHVEAFIKLFGDTLDLFWDQNRAGVDISPFGSGGLAGMYKTNDFTSGYNVFTARDFETVLRSTGEARSDNDDTTFFGKLSAQYDSYGSFLVRDYTPVPEPTPIALSLLTGLLLILRKKF